MVNLSRIRNAIRHRWNRWILKKTGVSPFVRARRHVYAFRFKQAREILDNCSLTDPETARRARHLVAAIEHNMSGSLLQQEEPEEGQRQEAADGRPRRVGSWRTTRAKSGMLKISGRVNSDCKQVCIFINDRAVKFVNTSKHGEFRRFYFNMKKSLRNALPGKTTIGVGSRVGYLQLRGGGLVYEDEVLGGNGKLFRKLDKGYFITKKGKLKLPLDLNDGWKDRALAAYAEFRDYFEQTFGYQPFIICGTLLGYYREGDFIAHDDDMDTAYFSRETSPEAVKSEMQEIILRMVRDGFDIQLSRKRGFFKPRINGIRFDVFTMWADEGCLWMMNTTRQESSPENIVPVASGSFRGTDVYIPRNPERFLELEYGKGWRIPDPGYRSIASPGTEDYLKRCCLSLEELESFYSQLVTEAGLGNGTGKFSAYRHRVIEDAPGNVRILPPSGKLKP